MEKPGLLLSLLLVASASAACNVVTTGDHGRLTFTPDDCGQAFCSLDFELAAGASVDVDLAAASRGVPISGLTLVADDARVAVVVPIPLGVGWRWRVIGVDGGRARLVAVDARGLEVDRTTIEVRRASRLALELERGPAASYPTSEPDLEMWAVAAASPVAFRVRPLDWAGGELMGKLALASEMDTALYHSLDPSARLPEGELAVGPLAPGDYGVTFFDPQGLFLDVLLEVR
jgi:hypothetical protein